MTTWPSWRRDRVQLATAVAGPTLYLWVTDHIAIADGIWCAKMIVGGNYHNQSIDTGALFGQ